MPPRDLLLCEPLLDEGIEDVAFWNGRVLVAEDLTDQRHAHIERSRLVGRAVGDGVVRGLLVTAASGHPTAVDVGAGLAVSRRGDVLRLPVDVRLALVPPPGPTPSPTGFRDCNSPDPGGTLTGTGVYVVVIGPAEGTRASAPAVTFDSDGVVRECGPKYEVDGVRFRLVLVDPVGMAGASGHDAEDVAALSAPVGAPSRRRRRNVLAHLFLGTVPRRESVVDPFGADGTAYGPLDSLRAGGLLGDDEVPLAVVSWAGGGVEFADSWPVRRRVHRSGEAETTLASLTSSRLRAEGEATWNQFQDHLGDLAGPGVTDVELRQVRAVDHFRYLPAAGALPFSTSNAVRGFDYLRFVESLTTRDQVHIAGAAMSGLLRTSFDVPPVDVTSGEMLWLYRVRETFRAFDTRLVGRPRPYLLFASGHLAYLGDAQYDLSWWDYANYARRGHAVGTEGGA